MGSDRRPVPAQDLSHRLQVHGKTRRGRGSDPGDLSEGLPEPRQVQPRRGLLDVALERGAELLHRPLPGEQAGDARCSWRTSWPSTWPLPPRATLTGSSRSETGSSFVRRGLEMLPEKLREAVVLRDLQGLSYQEMADRLRLPEGTVKSRINRGREELARLLLRAQQPGRTVKRGRGARPPGGEVMELAVEAERRRADRPREGGEAHVPRPRRRSSPRCDR